MSASVGLRKWSPRSERPCTASATSVPSDRTSCRARRSGRRARIILRLITRPIETARLASTSEAMPAARLVIQNRWGAAEVAMIIVM
jgi:hypothetical protein